MDTPARIYSRTLFVPIAPFLRHLSNLTTLTFSLLLHSCSLNNLSSICFTSKLLVKIEPLPPLDLTPVFEKTLNRPITTRVLAPTPQTANKATR